MASGCDRCGTTSVPPECFLLLVEGCELAPSPSLLRLDRKREETRPVRRGPEEALRLAASFSTRKRRRARVSASDGYRNCKRSDGGVVVSKCLVVCSRHQGAEGIQGSFLDEKLKRV
jgi:hypothetical protein